MSKKTTKKVSGSKKTKKRVSSKAKKKTTNIIQEVETTNDIYHVPEFVHSDSIPPIPVHKPFEFNSNPPPEMDPRETNSKYLLSRFDFELFDEESNKKHTLYQVKRTTGKTLEDDKWKVLENNKHLFTIEASNLSEKELDFIKTIDGFNFILNCAKNNISSVRSFMKELQSHLKSQ